MKTTYRSILTTLLMMVLLSNTTALAHAPTVTIETVGGISVTSGINFFDVPEFPYPLPVEGLLTHDEPGGVNQVTLTLFVDGQISFGPERQKGNGGVTTIEYFLPWEIPAPGIYQLGVLATHEVKGSESEGCKVAPALAAAFLKANPEYKEAGVMEQVASETGKKGTLWAKEKCEPNYYTKTIELLVE